ncbi:MAG: uncharacterized protein QG635_680 [Bacteroidota bacterium]|nr:uncharacterized protein [Bacteroidota bacterium]
MQEMKPKVVIDTNVIISSLLSEGYPYKIFNEIIFDNKVILLLSEEIINEYVDVLSRKKFTKYPDFNYNAKLFLDTITVNSKMINVNTSIDLLSDKDDNKFLELAIDGTADFLITGNIKHFPSSGYNNIVIESPKDFYLRFLKIMVPNK